MCIESKSEKIFSPTLTPAYRSQYGSVNPAGIVGPAIVATALSTVVAMVLCKIKNRKQK